VRLSLPGRAIRETKTESRGPQGQMPRTRPDAGRSGGSSTAQGGGSAPARRPPAARELWGTRPGRLGVFAVIGATLLGLVITLLSGTEPGVILGVFLVAGTLAAATAVRPGAVYLIFPVPALAYAVAAVIAGFVHDRGVDTSHTALAISAAQWIAGGFVAMTVATALAMLIAGYRWLRGARPAQGTAQGRPEPPR
jgi:hypothetical protein